MTWVVWLRDDEIQVEKGKVVEYQSDMVRAFCEQCGSRVWNRKDDLVGVFPGSFDAVPAAWEPTMHDAISEAILPHDKINDGIPRCPRAAPQEAKNDDTLLRGRCHCGEVEFTVKADPEVALSGGSLCHCESCRRATGSTLLQVRYVKPEAFTITKGVDLIHSVVLKPGWGTDRKFCSACGSRIYNLVVDWGDDAAKFRGAIGFFPPLIPDFNGQTPAFCLPKIHVNFEETILPLDKWNDGLIRW